MASSGSLAAVLPELRSYLAAGFDAFASGKRRQPGALHDRSPAPRDARGKITVCR